MTLLDQNQALLALLQEKDTLAVSWLTALGSDVRQDSYAKTLVEARELLASMLSALKHGGSNNIEGEAWREARLVLESLSRERAAQGRSAGETSAFVLKLKTPIFDALPQYIGTDQSELIALVTVVSDLIDSMAQWTMTTYQRAREEIINRQQQELLELSTPVIKLWDGVLAVPMIGTLDSSRTQLVMESLLQRIVETESTLAIIDITGVPTVDTLVAQHLLKTVTAIRLMGADCIISGIRPQIAQTIVHLGIDLKGVTSKATLADALGLALKRTGYVVTRPAKMD